jgi:hypothetical protein
MPNRAILAPMNILPTTGIRRVEKRASPLYELTVGKALNEIAEPHQGSEDRHHALFAEAKSGSVETIISR